MIGTLQGLLDVEILTGRYLADNLRGNRIL